MDRGARIRVAHVVGYLHFGGKEGGIVNLVNRLDPERFESFAFTYLPGGHHAQRLDLSRCKVIPLGNRMGGGATFAMRLAKAFRRHRIDIAHTHSWGTLLEGLFAARVTGVPVVIHGEHGTMITRSRWHVLVQRFAWGRMDQVLSVSEELRMKLASTMSFPVERIRAIPNGVDLSRFGSRIAREESRARLGLPRDSFILGTVGRLVPVKAYPVLLEAARQVFDRVPEAALAIGGGGPLENELRAWVSAKNLDRRVHFLGFRHDAPELYNALDVFVLASDSEGMSNTILEAMASRLPVVATAVGGNPELVAEGITGHLVPPRNSERLAEAIVRLHADAAARVRMGASGRLRVEREFSIERMVQAYEALYLDALSRKRRVRHELIPLLRSYAAAPANPDDRADGPP